MAKSIPKNNTNETGNKKEGRYKNKRTMYKLVIAIALFAAAFASSLPVYRAFASYHPAPVYKEKKLFLQPFGYEYDNDYSKNNFQRLRLKMKKPKLLDLSKLLFLMAKFIQPPDK